MNVIDAIRGVVTKITIKVPVTEDTSDPNDTKYTVPKRSMLWVGAWVELFGENENKRYQIASFIEDSGVMVVIFDTSKKLEIGITDLALVLDYQFGHAEEMQQTFAEQVKDTEWKAKQYPKLLLFLDIEEDWGEMVETSLDLAIITSTQKEWKAKDREKKSFEDVLHPLFYLFLDEVERAGGIETPTPLRFRKFDRYFWGSDPQPDKNVFAALLDAVEINDFQITINKKLCNNYKR